MLLEESDYQAAQEAVGKALDIARQEGDAALELRALVDASEVAIYHANYDDVAELGERAIALTTETDDLLFQALAHYHASISLFVLGESDKVSWYAAAGGAAAERIRHPFFWTASFSSVRLWPVPVAIGRPPVSSATEGS